MRPDWKRWAFRAYAVRGAWKRNDGTPRSYPEMAAALNLEGIDALTIREWTTSDFPAMHRRVITYNPPGGFPAPATTETA